MTEIRLSIRNVEVVDIEDSRWDWEETNKRLTSPSLSDHVRLAFRPWQIVLAPKGTKCSMETMGGFPIYEYKELDGRAFFLRPEGAPGY